MHSTRNDSDEDSAKAQPTHRAFFMPFLKISQSDFSSFGLFESFCSYRFFQQDRFVLVIDFWHPDLTIPEREERELEHGSFLDVVKQL